jgi:hypothetical protein
MLRSIEQRPSAMVGQGVSPDAYIALKLHNGMGLDNTGLPAITAGHAGAVLHPLPEVSPIVIRFPSLAQSLLLCLVLAFSACRSEAAPAEAHSATSLRALHDSMAQALQHNDFGRPLVLRSSDSDSDSGLQGEVYAELAYPFEAMSKALINPASWCELMLVHLNNRQCRLARDSQGPVLLLSVVRKYDQAPEQAMRLVLEFRVLQASADFLEVELRSAQGPMGTSNYRIVLQATALQPALSFSHFAYSYDSNAFARMATQVFLSTFGSGKVGFTVTGRHPDGTPEYIAGTRGLMERNAMRYFLAIDAYLSALSLAPAEQFEKRLDHWFSATEHYPRQLHDLDRGSYLELKRADQLRERAAGPT